jgi:hypothetical protein
MLRESFFCLFELGHRILVSLASVLKAICSEKQNRFRQFLHIDKKMCSSLTLILLQRELGMPTCLTHTNIWCNTHKKQQIATRTFCTRLDAEGLEEEELDYTTLCTRIELCTGGRTVYEFVNAYDRKEEEDEEEDDRERLNVSNIFYFLL